VQRSHLAPASLLAFNITAHTSNPIPPGGFLQLSFSADFLGLEPASCLVLAGLKAQQGQTKCEVFSNMTVVFRPAGLVVQGPFTVQVKVTTPQRGPGKFTLATYSPAQLIDQSSPQLVELEALDRMHSASALWSDARAGQETELSLIFRPNKTFQNGHMRLRLPVHNVFLNRPSVVVCGVDKEEVMFASFNAELGVMDIQLPSRPIPNTCDSSIDVTTGGGSIRLPTTPGALSLELLLNDGAADVESYMLWVQVQGSAFQDSSLTSASLNPGSVSVYQWGFVPTVLVPSWEDGGLLELEFDLQAWGAELGTGLSIGSSLPCSQAIHCVLIRPAVVQIQQFPSIPPMTVFNFTLGGISNPSRVGSFSVTLTAFLHSQSLHSASHSLVLFKGSDINNKSAQATLTPTTINTPCNLTLTFPADRGNSLLLQLHADFFSSAALLCYMDKKRTPCSGFSNSGLVLLSKFRELESSSEHQVLISGLISPRYVLPPSTLRFYVLQTGSESGRFESTVPGLSPGQISQTTVTMDSNEAGSLDTTYFFIFTPQNSLDFNGTLRVSFPADYLLLAPLDCAFNGTAPETLGLPACWVQGNWVTISTLGVEADSALTVKIAHIANPETAGWTSDFALESYSDQGLLIDCNSHIPGISLSRKQPKVPLVHLGVKMNPNNRNFPGDVSLTFLPASSLPKGTSIEVTFPAVEFPQLPLNPDCSVSGGVTLLQNCTAKGSVLTATTSLPYLRGMRPAPITLLVRSLQSEGSTSESDLFTIKLRYARFLIDESPASVSNRTLSFGSEPKTLTLVDFDYSPKTAGEEAIYSFTLIPASDFQPSCVLGVRFGPQFPRRLSYALQCVSKQLAASDDMRVDCYEADRTVVVSSPVGWHQSASAQDLTLELRRIVNPAENLGPIALFTQCGDTLLDYLLTTPAHTPEVPPQPLVLSAFHTSTAAAGQLANITLTVTGLPVDRELDLVLVTFSQDFDLDFVHKKITCLSALFSNVSSVACDYEQGTVSIAAFPPDFTSGTSLEVVVQGVENPWEVREVLYPVVSVYDATHEVIVAKTAANLSRLPGLHYQHSLFSIQVNDNRPWSQNKGTVSEFIYVTLEAPASREFSISYRGNIPGVKVSPFAVIFPQGAVTSQFRLEISQSAARGNYTIEWNVNGAWYEPKYAARRFQVEVTDLGNEQVLVSAAESVEQGGQAVSTVVLQHAPCNELALRLVQLSPQPSRLTFAPEVLRFEPGEISKQFTIRVSEDSYGDLGEFFIYKEGINANTYFLPRSVFSFRVKPREGSPARVTALQVLEANRTAVRLLAATDRPVSLYWMLAWFGTSAPRLAELQSRSFEGKTPEKPQFALTQGVVAAPYRYEHEVIFTGLRAQTRYMMYVQMEGEQTTGQGGNFTTGPHLRSAYVTLRFRSALESSEKAELLRTVAGLLILPLERLVLTESKRLNSTLPAKSGTRPHLCHLVLVTDPYDAGTRSPRTQLASLDSFRSQLKVASVSLDESADLSPVDLPFTPPAWKSTPAIGLLTSKSVRLDSVLLTDFGNVHLCAVKQEQPPTPLSAQIVRGQDFFNRDCWYKASVQTTASHSSVLLNSLQADTSYWVYLSADNDWPGQPDLLEDSLVQTIGFKTLTVEEERRREQADKAGADTLALGGLLFVLFS